MLWAVCSLWMNDIFSVGQMKVKVPIRRGKNIRFFVSMQIEFKCVTCSNPLPSIVSIESVLLLCPTAPYLLLYPWISLIAWLALGHQVTWKSAISYWGSTGFNFLVECDWVFSSLIYPKILKDRRNKSIFLLSLSSDQYGIGIKGQKIAHKFNCCGGSLGGSMSDIFVNSQRGECA